MLHTLRTFRALLLLTITFAAACTGYGQNLESMQPFDMVIPSTYGGGVRPNEGFYVGIDFMATYISRPRTSTIGSDVGRGTVYYVERPLTYTDTAKGDPDETHIMVPTITVNPNDSYQIISDQDVSTYDTSMLDSQWACGRRYEAGYMWGHHGWGVSVYDINDLSQSYTVENAKVAFNVADKPRTDGSYLYGVTTVNGTEAQTFPGNTNDVNSTYVYGELGVKYESLTVSNTTATNGVELNYTYRFAPRDQFGMRYGIWEVDMGVRWFQYEEEFNVYGRGGSLSDSWWNTKSSNNLIGPQISARYFRTWGRWTFDVQGKFMAAINNQSVDQNGVLGSFLSNRNQSITEVADDGEGNETYTTTYYQYLGLQGYPGYANSTSMTFNHRGTDSMFAPLLELRLNAKLQLTQLVNLRIGYTGIYVGNIARSAEMVEYNIPGTSTAMGINMDRNTGSSLVHGVTVGVEINR